MKKSIKRLLIFAAAIILIVVGVIGYNAIKARRAIMAQFEGTPTYVEATKGDVKLYISVSGNIDVSDHVRVKANTLGEVANVYYNVGDKVEAGDVLYDVSDETLKDQIENLEKQIRDQQLLIDKTKLPNDTLYIKSSVEGTAKDIKGEYGDDVAEVMEEHGYLALISLQDKMLIKVTDEVNQYTKDMEVKVYCESHRYKGVVDKVESDAAYILIDTDSRTVGAAGYVYDTDGNKLGKGYAELYDFIKVTAQNGTIKEVYTYEDETLSFNEQLFRISADPQDLINKYDELDDLKEQLSEKQTMLESIQIKAPVSGFITEMSLKEGDTIENDSMVVSILADTSSWVATVEVDELDINTVQPGQSVVITADAIPDQTFNGTVRELSSMGTSSQGITTYDVKIEVPANPEFKSAMSITAEILTQSAEDTIYVPVEAVRTVGDRSYVVVKVDRGEEEKEAIRQTIIKGDTASKTAFANKDKATITMTKDGADKGAGKNNGERTGRGNMQKNASDMMASTLLSPLEQLYGEVRFVEVGLKNETSAQILSGLEEGESIILISKTGNTIDFSKMGFGMPMGKMAGGGGGRK